MKKSMYALTLSLMLMTAPAFASSDSIDLGSARKDVKTEDTVNIPSYVLSGDINAVGNQVVSQEIQKMKENGPEWMKRTDITLYFYEGLKPRYSVETIQPIGNQSERVTTFTQFRIGNDLGEGVTANLGFGKRYLSKDKSSMNGVNVFYDHGFKYGHARVGAGYEYFEGRNEYRANIYHAISGEKEIDTKNHIFEKALSGYDAEIGTSFPNAPWAKLFVQGYAWDYTYSDDMKGYKIRSEVQVTPQVNLEFGYDHNNKGSSGNYAKLMYNMGNKGPAMFEKDKPMFRSNETVSVEGKRLEKVKRENEILVERYQKTVNGNGQLLIISMTSN